ncbi:MAG: SDR family oxidoreductase [bacterium]|nr:SDR family oxidoreductase [bacterium]
MAFDIDGAVVLITGGNAGIGKATAIALARKGARVTFTSRDDARGKIALDEIRQASGRDDVGLLGLDLARLASVRRCAEAFGEQSDRLDVLINNAGIALTRGPRQETYDGLEMQFGVNHVGHFRLTQLLLPLIRKSAPARIVNLSSAGYLLAPDGLDFDDLQSKKDYKGFPCYGHSKLANIYFTTELARRLEGADIAVNAVHPGLVDTELGHLRPEDKARFVREEEKPAKQAGAGGGPDLSSLGAPLTPEEGAATSIRVASAPDVEGITGRYFADSEATELTPVASDAEAAGRLWRATEALLAELGV